MVSDILGCRVEGQAEDDILENRDPVPAHTVPEAGIQPIALDGGIHVLIDTPGREVGQVGMSDYKIPHSQPVAVVVQSGKVRHTHQVADT